MVVVDEGMVWIFDSPDAIEHTSFILLPKLPICHSICSEARTCIAVAAAAEGAARVPSPERAWRGGCSCHDAASAAGLDHPKRDVISIGVDTPASGQQGLQARRHRGGP